MNSYIEVSMPHYKETFLKDAYKHSSAHREEVLDSDSCACFFCLETFKSTEIHEWIDETNKLGATAMCPKCGIDSIIGAKSGFPISDINFLKQLNKLYFG